MAGMIRMGTPRGRTISSSIFSAASLSVTTPASVRPRALSISAAFIAWVRWPVPLPQKETTKRSGSPATLERALTPPCLGPWMNMPIEVLEMHARGGLIQLGAVQDMACGSAEQGVPLRAPRCAPKTGKRTWAGCFAGCGIRTWQTARDAFGHVGRG
eukprot:1694763-Prymnesium_polylepis.2